MSNCIWRFPPSNGGVEQGINDGGIATFKGSELYSNLAREICQNSLDAKAEGERTVVVDFTLRSFKKKDYPELKSIEDIIDRCEYYWEFKADDKMKAFIAESRQKLSADTIDCLLISDHNTKGLSGARVDIRQPSVWRALTHSDGVTQKGAGSAGSYGIGKSAPFACSSFRTVFYNSYSIKDKLKAFQGVSRLVSHFDENNKPTQGVGYYQNYDESKEEGLPIFEEDECLFRDAFSRDDYGTDVIITGFKKSETWEEDIEKAIICNFFVAIHNEDLIVNIGDLSLTKDNLKDRIDYYANKEAGTKENRVSIIFELYNALTLGKEIKGSIMEDEDVSLFILMDDNYSKTIAEMRSTGMVIRTRKKNILARYSAVMIVHDGNLNQLLKDIEPPQHNEWDPGIIEDEEKKKNAKKYRNELIRWTNDTIVEECQIDLPDEMDLDGISQYLPFDEDDMSLGANGNETPSLNSESTLGEKKTTTPNVRKKSLSATQVQGRKNDDMDPHNSNSGGSKGGSGGVEVQNGDDTVTSVSAGGKSVNVPKIEKQRVMKAPSPSTYRVTLSLEEDCESVHLALSSIGDDKKKEKIKIISYKTKAGKDIVTNSNSIEVGKLKANTVYEYFLVLEYSEKMLLDLIVY